MILSERAMRGRLPHLPVPPRSSLCMCIVHECRGRADTREACTCTMHRGRSVSTVGRAHGSGGGRQLHLRTGETRLQDVNWSVHGPRSCGLVWQGAVKPMPCLAVSTRSLQLWCPYGTARGLWWCRPRGSLSAGRASFDRRHWVGRSWAVIALREMMDMQRYLLVLDMDLLASGRGA